MAPPERFSRSRTWAVLLPWWAPVAFFLGDLADVAALVAFFAGVALWPDLALDDATLACVRRRAAFWGALAARPGLRPGCWRFRLECLRNVEMAAHRVNHPKTSVQP